MEARGVAAMSRDDTLITYALDHIPGQTEAMRWLARQVRQQEREACARLAEALRVQTPVTAETYRHNVAAAIRALV